MWRGSFGSVAATAALVTSPGPNVDSMVINNESSTGPDDKKAAALCATLKRVYDQSGSDTLPRYGSFGGSGKQPDAESKAAWEKLCAKAGNELSSAELACSCSETLVSILHHYGMSQSESEKKACKRYWLSQQEPELLSWHKLCCTVKGDFTEAELAAVDAKILETVLERCNISDELEQIRIKKVWRARNLKKKNHAMTLKPWDQLGPDGGFVVSAANSDDNNSFAILTPKQASYTFSIVRDGMRVNQIQIPGLDESLLKDRSLSTGSPISWVKWFGSVSLLWGVSGSPTVYCHDVFLPPEEDHQTDDDDENYSDPSGDGEEENDSTIMIDVPNDGATPLNLRDSSEEITLGALVCSEKSGCSLLVRTNMAVEPSSPLKPSSRSVFSVEGTAHNTKQQEKKSWKLAAGPSKAFSGAVCAAQIPTQDASAAAKFVVFTKSQIVLGSVSATTFTLLGSTTFTLLHGSTMLLGEQIIPHCAAFLSPGSGYFLYHANTASSSSSSSTTRKTSDYASGGLDFDDGESTPALNALVGGGGTAVALVEKELSKKTAAPELSLRFAALSLNEKTNRLDFKSSTIFPHIPESSLARVVSYSTDSFLVECKQRGQTRGGGGDLLKYRFESISNMSVVRAKLPQGGAGGEEMMVLGVGPDVAVSAVMLRTSSSSAASDSPSVAAVETKGPAQQEQHSSGAEGPNAGKWTGPTFFSEKQGAASPKLLVDLTTVSVSALRFQQIVEEAPQRHSDPCVPTPGAGATQSPSNPGSPVTLVDVQRLLDQQKETIFAQFKDEQRMGSHSPPPRGAGGSTREGSTASQQPSDVGAKRGSEKKEEEAENRNDRENVGVRIDLGLIHTKDKEIAYLKKKLGEAAKRGDQYKEKLGTATKRGDQYKARVILREKELMRVLKQLKPLKAKVSHLDALLDRMEIPYPLPKEMSETMTLRLSAVRFSAGLPAEPSSKSSSRKEKEKEKEGEKKKSSSSSSGENKKSSNEEKQPRTEEKKKAAASSAGSSNQKNEKKDEKVKARSSGGDTENYVKRMVAFYKFYGATDKANDLYCRTALRHYKGKEEAVFRALVTKYGPEPGQKKEAAAEKSGGDAVNSSADPQAARKTSAEKTPTILGVSPEPGKSREKQVTQAKPRGMSVEEALRSGEWVEQLDKKTGKKFYYHAKTKKATWDLAKMLGAPATQEKQRTKPAAASSAATGEAKTRTSSSTAKKSSGDATKSASSSSRTKEEKKGAPPTTAQEAKATTRTSSSSRAQPAESSTARSSKSTKAKQQPSSAAGSHAGAATK